MCLIKEVWKDVPDYPNYQVSNYGRVKSLKYGKEKILKLRKGGNNDYLLVTLYKGSSKQYNRLVHRIMAESFNLENDNPTEKTQINHINENPEFNFIAIVNNEIVSSSIEYCDSCYNCNYGIHKENISNSLKGKYCSENNPMYGKHHSEEAKQKMSEARKGKGIKPILQFTKEGVFIQEWNSIKQASNELNICESSIIRCCQGKLKSANNFVWKYKE
jgi:hypothetical protein